MISHSVNKCSLQGLNNEQIANKLQIGIRQGHRTKEGAEKYLMYKRTGICIPVGPTRCNQNTELSGKRVPPICTPDGLHKTSDEFLFCWIVCKGDIQPEKRLNSWTPNKLWSVGVIWVNDSKEMSTLYGWKLWYFDLMGYEMWHLASNFWNVSALCVCVLIFILYRCE